MAFVNIQKGSRNIPEDRALVSNSTVTLGVKALNVLKSDYVTASFDEDSKTIKLTASDDKSNAFRIVKHDVSGRIQNSKIAQLLKKGKYTFSVSGNSILIK